MAVEGFCLPSTGFGLLSGLLGATSLISIFTSSKYYMTKARARTPGTLKEAFVVALLVYAIAHAIGAADIWLHSVASTVVLPVATPIDDLFPFSVAQNSCAPYPPDWQSLSYQQCQFSPELGWIQFGMEAGKLVSSNTSSTLRAITLHDANDTAVLVSPEVNQSMSFTMTSFAARASCTSLNAQCVGVQFPLEGGGVTVGPTLNCTSLDVSQFPPALVSPLPGGTNLRLNPGDSTALIMTSPCSGCNPIPSNEEMGTLEGSPEAPPSVNPLRVMVQVVWEQIGDRGWDPTINNTAITIIYSDPFSYKTLLADCSLGFYNVTMKYDNGSYSLLGNPVLSNTGLSDGLAGPTRLAHYASRLVDNLEGLALTTNSSDETMALLNQELGRLSLASAAALTNLRENATDTQRLDTQLLGRYPAAPVYLLITLLYLYALLALLIFLNVSLTTKSTTVTLTGPDEPGKRIATVELAQLPLAQPLALVAELFPSHDPAQRTRLSMARSALERFEESEMEGPHAAVERIKIGVYASGIDGAAVFGIRPRNNHDKEEK